MSGVYLGYVIHGNEFPEKSAMSEYDEDVDRIKSICNVRVTGETTAK